MNILESIEFNPVKPIVLQIKKTETIKIFCVALCKDQLLQKHQAKVPSLLIVLNGVVDFQVDGEVVTLREFDIYQIPVNIDHEVKGRVDKNVIMITQELKAI
jgi:quercetin dioxygenase-like cupin family protein